MTTVARRPRADAERNRAAVLAAADHLFASAAAGHEVTTDEIARTAGVGKGTIFRAFGDRGALLRALFDERGNGLMQRVEDSARHLRGPAERISYVLDEIVRFKLANRGLTLALERGSGSPFVGAHYDPLHAVLAGLLRRLGHGAELDFEAHALLSAVRSDLIEHLAGDLGWSARRIRRHLAAFAAHQTNGAP